MTRELPPHSRRVEPSAALIPRAGQRRLEKYERDTDLRTRFAAAKKERK